MLMPGERILVGEERRGPDCFLAYQGDGNLVLYSTSVPGHVLWSWYVSSPNPGWVEMQIDGNLVAYNADGVYYAQTATFAAGSYAVWDAERGLRIVGAVWISGVDPAPTVPEPPLPPVVVPPVAPVRRLVGKVGTLSRSFGDFTGPRILHGCSDFAALPKFHQDRDKTLRELDIIAAHQQYVRVLWRLNGWYWSGGPRPINEGGGNYPSANLSVDPIRDSWYDEVLRKYLIACRDRGLRVNLSSGDMNNWTMVQAIDSFKRTAQIADSVSNEVVWMGAVTNELRGTMSGGESPENIMDCETLLDVWKQYYPHSMRAVSDPESQDKVGMIRLSGGSATCALIHDVRWAAKDALRRAFNTRYENYPGKPIVQDEPTGPNGSPPHGPFTRNVYQPTEEHDNLFAIYTMHVLTGQASTYFNDPALVSREPIDSTWGLKEIPALWRLMEVPEDIGQGLLKPGHLADAPLQVEASNAERADSMVRSNYAIGIISGGSNWKVRAGYHGRYTIFNSTGRVWEGVLNQGDTIPASGPSPVVVRVTV